VILDSLPHPAAGVLPESLQRRAELHAAATALSAQASALADLVARLEVLRRTVPTGDANARWRGPAHTAYRASVRELGGRLDEAISVVAAAQLNSRRALSAIDARVR
jgi:hypothetical protein